MSKLSFSEVMSGLCATQGVVWSQFVMIWQSFNLTLI